MRRRNVLLAIALLLPVAQQLHWATLAAGSLAALASLLVVEAAGFAVAAVGFARMAPRVVGAGLAVAAACELTFLLAPAMFVPAFDLAPRLLLLANVGGLGWMATVAWREAPWTALRPGAALVLAFTIASIARDALGGDTFLLAGYALGAAGWTLALILLSRGGDAAVHQDATNAAQGGALP